MEWTQMFQAGAMFIVYYYHAKKIDTFIFSDYQIMQFHSDAQIAGARKMQMLNAVLM